MTKCIYKIYYGFNFRCWGWGFLLNTKNVLNYFIGCDSGTYGQNCSNSCGSCTNKEMCDKVNGICFSCNPGWNLPFCTEGNGTGQVKMNGNRQIF